MSPDNNNYFVIIIRIFSANDSFFQKYRFFHLLLTCFLFSFHRIHDFTNYLHNTGMYLGMYLFCMGAIHRGYL